LSEIEGFLSKKSGRLTSVQVGLIAKKLEDTGLFKDTHGSNRATQNGVFILTVVEYTTLASDTVESFL